MSATFWNHGGGDGGWAGFLPITDQDLFRQTLAQVWIFYPNRLEWETFPEFCQLGEDLLEALAPLAALQLYGTAAEFDRRHAAVLEALGHTPSRPVFADTKDAAEGDRVRQDGVLRWAVDLAAFRERMSSAEGELLKRGWRFHAGRLVLARAGGRPYQFRRKLVLGFARALRGGRLENDQALRDEIAEVLRWWLPEDDVSPAKDGPIDRDLKNEVAKARR